MRHPPLTVEQIHARLVVDCEAGRCYWLDPTKHHKRLRGLEAGSARHCSHGDGYYWVIKINGVPYKRAQIILAVATGQWPTDVVDHINRIKSDDRAVNLRHATVMQNNWNQDRRAKRSGIPMGVRQIASGRFQARIGYENRQIVIGTYATAEAAREAYLQKRKEFFHAYS